MYIFKPIKKNTSRHNKVLKKKQDQVITGVFYAKIFRGFVHHRPFFRRLSKNPLKNP